MMSSQSKTLALLVTYLLFPCSVLCQDTLKFEYPKSRIGIGLKLSSPIYGPQLLMYHNRLSVEATYGLPTSSSRNTEVIDELKRGFSANLSLQLGYFKNKRAVAGKEFYWPLVTGVGYFYAVEKNQVKGYSGSGHITGAQYYLGMQLLMGAKPFRKVGGHIYFGYNQWNYDDSILVKSRAPLKYNRSKFYLSFALYYFLK
jgi:hypothetical protein